MAIICFNASLCCRSLNVMKPLYIRIIIDIIHIFFSPWCSLLMILVPSFLYPLLFLMSGVLFLSCGVEIVLKNEVGIFLSNNSNFSV